MLRARFVEAITIRYCRCVPPALGRSSDELLPTGGGASNDAVHGGAFIYTFTRKWITVNGRTLRPLSLMVPANVHALT